MNYAWAGSLCSRRRKHIWGTGRSPSSRPIGPQMCFWPVPGRTDVLKCTLSPGTGDKCVAGPAPIICDRGDNHAPGGISTFWGSQGDPGGPSGAPQGPSGPLPGLRADPGGVKNYPPRVTEGI